MWSHDTNVKFRNLYFVSFIDDYSDFSTVYAIKSKNEVFSKFKEFVAGAEALTNKQVKFLRCDQGGEYKSKEIINFCKLRGIIIDYMPRYTPQENRVAERFNRTIVEKLVTMLYDSKLLSTLWDQALETATYLTNRSPTSALEG